MADKSTHKYERPAKIRAVKAKHPKGFGTDKERHMKKEWYEVRLGGVLYKGTKESLVRLVKRTVKNYVR